ncbi:MAG: hypothetical protein NVV72_08770 [Asticcacaulis sp.]|nr:hypothetical protein [Asticcacaulis sp.]
MLKAFLAALGFLAVASSAHAADCQYDHSQLLALDYKAFDQDGWRPLADADGCKQAAADLIRDYRQAHPDLSADDRRSLIWHEGQMRAAFGDYAGAIPLLSTENPDPAMRDYAMATIAFLKHDKPALLAARTQLIAEPKPEGWDEAVAELKASGETIQWPLNLEVVDGLILCFDKPYAEAYGCRVEK